MKQKNMFKIALFGTLITGLFTSCGSGIVSKDIYYIMIDKTDDSLDYHELLDQSREEILELSEISLEGSSPNGLMVRTFEINSLSNNKSDEVELETGSVGLNGDNPLDRRDGDYHNK